MSTYPQSEKWAAASEQRAAIEEFLEWLSSRTPALVLGEWAPLGTMLIPTMLRTDDLFAEFFRIDRKALEQERRAMLADLQKQASPGGRPAVALEG